jgi:hypothetical protein
MGKGEKRRGKETTALERARKANNDHRQLKHHRRTQSSSSPPASATSVIPCAVIWNFPSASGMHGLSTILAIRSAPLPLRIETRVVEACAMMLPPMGFFWSAGPPGALSTEATTWLVTTTATPNCERRGGQ